MKKMVGLINLFNLRFKLKQNHSHNCHLPQIPIILAGKAFANMYIQVGRVVNRNKTMRMPVFGLI